MYIKYSIQRSFHLYFSELVDELNNEIVSGFSEMHEDPRPDDDWRKAPSLVEAVWSWDNAATIHRLHYSGSNTLYLLFGSGDTNHLSIEYYDYDDYLDQKYHTVADWDDMSDEQFYSDDFIKDVIRAYRENFDNKKKLIKSIDAVVKNGKNYKPNVKIINSFRNAD